MKLPNGDRAVVSDEKLYGYLLNLKHTDGGSHTYLFKTLLGIDRSNGELLRHALLDTAANDPATPGQPSRFGTKYEVRFPMHGPRGTYTVLSVWIIDEGADVPRIVTAYIEKQP